MALWLWTELPCLWRVQQVLKGNLLEAPLVSPKHAFSTLTLGATYIAIIIFPLSSASGSLNIVTDASPGWRIVVGKCGLLSYTSPF